MNPSLELRLRIGVTGKRYLLYRSFVHDVPAIHYARCEDGAHIAYQVFGDGPIDLVVVPGFISHLEHFWESPAFARLNRQLSSFARVITFDKRGTG